MSTEPTPDTPAAPVVHIYVLLDRSGSMASIADDIIGGFNRYLADQQAEGPDARMTLIQFDSQDPHDVVADAVPVREMAPLDHSTFVPRGGTPLLDATGRILGRATRRAQELAAARQPAEEIVIVSVTDGHENASRELSLATVRRMIEDRKRDGWSFVFLSAADDVYAEAGGLGYDHRSSQSFRASRAGATLAFHTLSSSTTSLRDKVRRHELFDKDDFFEGDKPAEDHRRRGES